MAEIFATVGDEPRRRRGVIALVVAVAMIIVLTVSAAALLLGVQLRLDRDIERIPGLTLHHGAALAADSEPVNVLLLGTDSRISAGDPTQWEVGAQRTDAMMLVQLSADRRSLTAMSIPRDSWVEVPGHGHHKINAAFSFGGPQLTIDTVEHLTGVRADHFVVADFESFVAVTDELDGVDITLSQPLEVGGEVLDPGPHRLDGAQALHYARERTNVEGGDFGRVQRQQNWMRSVMARAVDGDLLTDPLRLARFLDTATQSVAVDDSLTLGTMRDLAIGARHLRAEGIQFITAPYRGTGWSPDGRQSIVVLDDKPMARVSAAFTDGTVHELLRANPDIAPRLGEKVH
ncbi:LCP family protein [Georgenia sp. Marseille-Q6866]